MKHTPKGVDWRQNIWDQTHTHQGTQLAIVTDIIEREFVATAILSYITVCIHTKVFFPLNERRENGKLYCSKTIFLTKRLDSLFPDGVDSQKVLDAFRLFYTKKMDEGCSVVGAGGTEGVYKQIKALETQQSWL